MQRAEDRQLAIPAIKEQFSLRTDRTIGMQSVPLYELDATAGLVALFDGTTRQVPVSHLQIPDLPPCDGALYVRGDSMYPLLKVEILYYIKRFLMPRVVYYGARCICYRSRLTARTILLSSIYKKLMTIVSSGSLATTHTIHRKISPPTRSKHWHW